MARHLKVLQFLIRSESEFPGLIRPLGRPLRRHIWPAPYSQTMWMAALVKILAPSLDLGSSVGGGQEPACVRALAAKAAVERFRERIGGGLARPAKSNIRPFSYARRSRVCGMNAGPLSTRMVLGVPRIGESRVIALTTCSPLTPWSTSVAKASRVKASTTVRARNRWPSNRAPETQSIDHISFAADAAGCCARLAALTSAAGLRATANVKTRGSSAAHVTCRPQPGILHRNIRLDEQSARNTDGAFWSGASG
jgi:hypothetical protein